MRLLASALLLLVACDEPPPAREPAAEPARIPDEPPPAEPAPTERQRARLPHDAGAFAPAHFALEGEVQEDLTDVERCAACHADVAAQWRSSAHAHASFGNPWYRAVVDAFREERGPEASRFCAGCHDIALLVDGAMDEEVRPDDRRAHAGVTCLVCHSTVESRADGNGSYRLRVAPVPIPDPNDPEEVESHRRRVVPEGLRTGALCGSCHRSFLGPEMGNPHHLPGIDDVGAWRRSPFAGSHAERVDTPLERRTCQGCHMAPEAAPHDFAATEGMVASHRVVGAHTALHAQTRPEAAPAERSRLGGAASVDVAAARVGERWAYPAERATPRPGAPLAFDVVVRNREAGHHFPGGTRDIQDSWLEVEVRDARGRLLGEAGTRQARREDPTALRLRAVLLDEEGRPDERHFVHAFRALAFDRSLEARDALAVRYTLRLPARFEAPLRIEARLRHRRHPRALRELACRASRSRRGRAFERCARRFGRTPLDGCVEEPITEVARRVVVLDGGAAPEAEAGARDREGAGVEAEAGAEAEAEARAGAGAREGAGAEARAGSAPWARLHDLALGLLHGVQERLDEARPVLEAALAALEEDRSLEDDERARAEAALRVLQGRVAGRQGRIDEALAHLEAAEALLPGHPAIARARGHAHAQVWQWPEAVTAYAAAAEGAPGDVFAWRDLARALGSAGDPEGALDAARRGLAFGPRQPDLLRSQALALGDLDADDPLHGPAHAAFLAHRRVDAQPALLRRCQRDVPGCDRDRQPVPQIRLRTP